MALAGAKPGGKYENMGSAKQLGEKTRHETNLLTEIHHSETLAPPCGFKIVTNGVKNVHHPVCSYTVSYTPMCEALCSDTAWQCTAFHKLIPVPHNFKTFRCF